MTLLFNWQLREWTCIHTNNFAVRWKSMLKTWPQKYAFFLHPFLRFFKTVIFFFEETASHMHANMPLLIFSSAHSTLCVHWHAQHTDGQMQLSKPKLAQEIDQYSFDIFSFSHLSFTHTDCCLENFWLICFQGFPLVFEPLSRPVMTPLIYIFYGPRELCSPTQERPSSTFQSNWFQLPLYS